MDVASILRKSKISLTQYPESKNQENPEIFPSECYIAVKCDGISILNADKKQLQFIPYHIVANWGIGPSLFVITLCEKEGEIVKYYFETKQGRVIQWIIENYRLLQSGKSMTEIYSITLNYDKKFGSESTGRVRTATTFLKPKYNK